MAADDRPTPPPARPGIRTPPPPKARPDPGPLRVVLGFGGLAAASAMAVAMLTPVTTTAVAGAPAVVAADPATPTRHIVRYVQLLPGQTAPPAAAVQRAPTPTPRVVTIRTRQSGAKP